MQALNLPPAKLTVRGDQQHLQVLDILRRKYVALTPEEWVRQHFVHFLIDHKHYPAALMANEVQLKVGAKTLRADSVLYNRQLQPRLIVEYKAPTVRITQEVFHQITSYNILLHAEYLVVSNGLEHFCCRIDFKSGSYHFLQDIPEYQEIASQTATEQD